MLPRIKEDENGWWKKIRRHLGAGAIMYGIPFQEAEENGPFRPMPIHPPPYFQEDENGWWKKIRRHLGAGGIMYGIPFQVAEESNMGPPLDCWHTLYRRRKE